MQVLTILASFILILYGTGVLLLFIFQTRLIFFPGKISKDYIFRKFPLNEEVFLKTSDGETINGLFFENTGTASVLYFHGNAGDLSGWQSVAEDFVEAGFNILIIDYRGYGKSTGSISEKGFYADAEAAWTFLTEQKNFPANRIIIYGRSIGTGVAMEMAVRKNPRGLILEAPYTALTTLANQKVPFFFPSLYLRNKFNNIKKLSKLKCPVVFIHGTNDTLIPPSHTRKLYDAFEGKKSIVLIPGGDHNGLPEHRLYREFLFEAVGKFFNLR